MSSGKVAEVVKYKALALTLATMLLLFTSFARSPGTKTNGRSTQTEQEAWGRKGSWGILSGVAPPLGLLLIFGHSELVEPIILKE